MHRGCQNDKATAPGLFCVFLQLLNWWIENSIRLSADLIAYQIITSRWPGPLRGAVLMLLWLDCGHWMPIAARHRIAQEASVIRIELQTRPGFADCSLAALPYNRYTYFHKVHSCCINSK